MGRASLVWARSMLSSEVQEEKVAKVTSCRQRDRYACGGRRCCRPHTTGTPWTPRVLHCSALLCRLTRPCAFPGLTCARATARSPHRHPHNSRPHHSASAVRLQSHGTACIVVVSSPSPLLTLAVPPTVLEAPHQLSRLAGCAGQSEGGGRSPLRASLKRSAVSMTPPLYGSSVAAQPPPFKAAARVERHPPAPPFVLPAFSAALSYTSAPRLPERRPPATAKG